MTSRRSEPIEAEHQTVEDILRPLVASTVECRDCHGWIGKVYTHNVLCQKGRIPDPRFEALRLPVLHNEGIDASLGAIIESARACGHMVYQAVLKALLDEFGVEPGTPLNAVAARALVRYTRGEKAASATEPSRYIP